MCREPKRCLSNNNNNKKKKTKKKNFLFKILTVDASEEMHFQNASFVIEHSVTKEDFSCYFVRIHNREREREGEGEREQEKENNKRVVVA